MNNSCKDFLHLFVNVQQLIKNMIMFCLYFFSLHHWKSKIALAIEMHIFNATIRFIVDITFLLQVIAMFTRMHDSMLRIHTLKKIFAMQSKVFCCVMRRHERKVIFKTKILEENLVLKLFCKWLNKQWLNNHWVIRVLKWLLWLLESEVITVSIMSVLLILLILLKDDQKDHSEQKWLDMILLYLYNKDYSFK